MSFANGRNFGTLLRLIVFGVGSGESANRRLRLGFRVGVVVYWIGTCLQLAGPRNPWAETISRSGTSKDSSVDESLLVVKYSGGFDAVLQVYPK